MKDVCGALDLDPREVDVAELLELSREAAHSIERRAAPITTYLIGVAVGRGRAPDEAAQKIRALLEKPQ
jgi:hypothetical protein